MIYMIKDLLFDGEIIILCVDESYLEVVVRLV